MTVAAYTMRLSANTLYVNDSPATQVYKAVNAKSVPGWFWLEPSEAVNEVISVSRGPGVKINTLPVVLNIPTPVPVAVNVKVRAGADMMIGAALLVLMVTPPFAVMVNVSPSPPLYVIGSPS
jgi:hypothetical protein